MPNKFYLGDMLDNFVNTRESEMKCDIFEQEGEYYIEMELPGFSKENIHLETDDGYLTITAEKVEQENENKRYIRRERYYGKCQRSFYLGEFDSLKVKASFDKGLLKVIVPKKKAIDAKKKIEIE